MTENDPRGARKSKIDQLTWDEMKKTVKELPPKQII